jgi:hypothetical protein
LSTPNSDSRFRRWAARRARQLMMAMLVLTVILVLGALGVLVRRATSLIGLPDIGDPFNVAAFRAVRVPDDEDAFVLFRQAAAKLGPLPDLPMAVRHSSRTVPWSQVDGKLREWLEANRPALSLFREGAFRVNRTAPTLVKPLQTSLTGIHFGSFVWLEFLDVARLEAQGDMKAAWDGYRAILCTKTHVMRGGIVFDRYVADQFCAGLEERIAAWAANSKTDGSLIRRALDDVRATEPKPEWDAFSLKLDYLQMTNMLDQVAGGILVGAEVDEVVRIVGESLPPNLVTSYSAARRYLANEPERSRRVLRLAFANWLARDRGPDQARLQPAVRASFIFQKRPTQLPFFALGQDAPAVAKMLSPQDLGRWLISTRDAKVLLFQWPWPAIRLAELRKHREIVISLAEELYRREHGSLPLSEAALVGTYLDHLPDDGSSELDDGTAARIDDSVAPPIARPE